MSRVFVVATSQIASALSESLTGDHAEYTVETATTFDEALSTLEAETFDAVVCQCDLQSHNGVELLRHVRRHGSTPFIFLSQTLSEEVVSLGVDGYVPTAGLDADSVARLVVDHLEELLSVVGSRELFDSVADGLVVHDPETGDIRDVNARFCEMMGYDRSELLGRSPDALTATDSGHSLDEARRLIRTARDEGHQMFEWQNQRKDGTEFPAEVHLRYVERNGPPYVLASVRDISERKSYQEELEWQRDQLEVLNRLLRHDVRNDLSVVMGWGEELRAGIPERNRPELDRMLRSARHAIELTKTVRDLVEVLRRGPGLRTEPMSLRDTLLEELDEVRTAYPGAEFDVGDVPDCSVRANELLRSVFRNLLNNAVQHNDKDVARVAVDCSTDADRVRVRITDNGPGIPDDRKRTLFEADQQLTEAEAHVGLFLVNRLLEEFGGAIHVADNDPTGTVFTLELRRDD